MKKGDVIQRELFIQPGEVLVRGIDNEEEVRAWMGRNSQEFYNRIPAYEVQPDDTNSGRFMAVSTSAFIKYIKAKVNWVVEDEVAIEYPDGGLKIVNLKEEEWKVIQESTVGYQSSVAGMSDEDLRASIDALRCTRQSAPVPKRGAVTTRVSANDPMAKALASMPADKKAELLKKLGLVD